MGIYGPRTVYCIALKDAPGCHEFLLQDDGKWLHVKETTEIGARAGLLVENPVMRECIGLGDPQKSMYPLHASVWRTFERLLSPLHACFQWSCKPSQLHPVLQACHACACTSCGMRMRAQRGCCMR
jgi:hypothetical protein